MRTTETTMPLQPTDEFVARAMVQIARSSKTQAEVDEVVNRLLELLRERTALLEACQVALKDAHDNGEDSPFNRQSILDALRSAIVKATGEPAHA